MTQSLDFFIQDLDVNHMPRILELDQQHSEGSSVWNEQQFLIAFDNQLFFPGIFIRQNNQDILLGYAICLTCVSELRILNIIIDDTYRRKNLGSRLMKSVIEYAIGVGNKYILLDVWVGNVGAISFYHKYGFRIISSRHNFYLTIFPHDAYLMELQLE